MLRYINNVSIDTQPLAPTYSKNKHFTLTTSIISTPVPPPPPPTGVVSSIEVLVCGFLVLLFPFLAVTDRTAVATYTPSKNKFYYYY